MRHLAEFVVFMIMWAWLTAFIWVGVGVLAADGPRMLLWPQVPGVVTAEGDTVSYAVRGQEFTADLRRLPAPGTRVDVYVNPLAPATAALDVRPAILEVDEPWVPVVLFGGAGVTVLGALMWWAGRRNTDTRDINEKAFLLVSGLVVQLGTLPVGLLPIFVVMALWPTGDPPDWGVRFAVGGVVGLAVVIAVLGWCGPYPNHKAWFKKMRELSKET
jgi:hypothetical protein